MQVVPGTFWLRTLALSSLIGCLAGCGPADETGTSSTGGGGAAPTGGNGGTTTTTGMGGTGAGGSGGTAGTGGVGGTGAGGGGAGGGRTCETPGDCGAPSSECVEVTCDGGTCGEAPKPAGTPLASQTEGDCKVEQCDGRGGVETAPDDADPGDDGNACTAETCDGGVPVITDLDGTPCEGGACQTGTCVVFTCEDTVKNGAETDVDCGGATCPGCVNGAECLADGDCLSGHCAGDVCVECEVGADCPAPDTDCQTPTCDAGMCGVALEAAGAPCDDDGGALCDGGGNCVPGVLVAGTNPADGATGVLTRSNISVTFTTAMDPATMTTQLTEGPCTGNIQVSSNDFQHCIPFMLPTAGLSDNGTVATLVPRGHLFAGTTYRIRVTTGAQSASGSPLAEEYTQMAGFRTVEGANACDGHVVISQVYGAGGNAGAPFMNDFVELHNIGTTPVDLANTSIQYASANGTSWAPVALSGTIPAGGFFLVQLAGGANGAPLPASDVSSTTINLAAGAGKVALVKGDNFLNSNACPEARRLIDFVAYGATSCYEGTATAPGLSAGTAAHRGETGCADTNNNVNDFTATAPAPRNTATAPSACACNAVANETGAAAEVDYCNLQFPATLSVTSGATTDTVYGRVYDLGSTQPAGAAPNVIAQLGVGPDASSPTTSAAWLWYPSAFNVQVGNDDEYQQTITAPLPGTYRYTYRVSFDGLRWTYCDLDGAGSNEGLDFSADQLGGMTVSP